MHAEEAREERVRVRHEVVVVVGQEVLQEAHLVVRNRLDHILRVVREKEKLPRLAVADKLCGQRDSAERKARRVQISERISDKSSWVADAEKRDVQRAYPGTQSRRRRTRGSLQGRCRIACAR